MLLAIDIGNTNTVFAVFHQEQLVAQWRIATDARRTDDEFAVLLSHLMQQHIIATEHITDCIIACVVPQALYSIQSFCSRYLHKEPIVISNLLDMGMKIEIDNPAEVGADRLVNAFAAFKQYQKAAIIVDFGTATNFDVVSSQGHYQGGVIAPGVQLSIEALHKAAAKLPKIDIKKPEKVTGRNTVAAIQSGMFYGYVGLIEGIIMRLKAEHNVPFITIATGGLASLYSSAIPAIDHLDQDLTIMGLKYIYDRLSAR